MKTRSSLFAVSFAGLIALTVTGCSTFQRDRGPSATRPVGGKSMELLELRDDVRTTRVSLDRTVEALNRVPQSPSARESYTAFDAELTAFNKNARSTMQNTAEVRERGRELFTEWSAETQNINNPEIRTAAEERRTTLERQYNALHDPMITARRDLANVRSDLRDIQKALALDLTNDGVQAVRPSIDEINRKADAARRSLDNLNDELNKIADTLPRPTVTNVTQTDEY